VLSNGRLCYGQIGTPDVGSIFAAIGAMSAPLGVRRKGVSEGALKLQQGAGLLGTEGGRVSHEYPADIPVALGGPCRNRSAVIRTNYHFNPPIQLPTA
jgi:hypothetical protein